MLRDERSSENASNSGSTRLSPVQVALLLSGLLLAAYAAYSPALEGPWVSDDVSVVRDNEQLHELSLDNFLAWFDPDGLPSKRAANYAPVHLGLHAMAWAALGRDGLVGHHAINVALHAINAALVALLFLRAGIPRMPAILGAALFLLHPAQVEAVAWISQLKTLAAFTFSLGALALWDRRPGLGAVLFGLGLLTKSPALFVLPVVIASDWVKLGHLRRAAWLGLWAFLAVVCLVPALQIFLDQGFSSKTGLDIGVSARNIVGIVPRYLIMAGTTRGLSTFHQPAPSEAWSDPWFLGGLVAVATLGAVWVSSLRARRPSAVWWTWAAAAYAPVSQVLPFANEMGDRYLYFVLPGLMGGVMLDAPRLGRALAARLPPLRGARVDHALVVAAAVAIVVLFAKSYGRAAIWQSESAVVADSVKNYPDSTLAHVLRARSAARTGDADKAAAELRIAVDRGYDRYQLVDEDASFQPVKQDPRIRELHHAMAKAWITRLESREALTQVELFDLAGAYVASGDRARAVEALERGLALGGPRDEHTRMALRALGRTP